jgi:HlyD family secretion protein
VAQRRQTAEVYLDSNPEKAISAEVIRVDPQAMFTPENTYFKEDRVKQVLGLKLGLRGAYGYAFLLASRQAMLVLWK